MQPTESAEPTEPSAISDFPPSARQRTAVEAVATLIQAVRRGEATPYDAAQRVLASLGLPVNAPLPPSPPTSNGVEDEERAAGSTSLPPPSPLLLATRALVECVSGKNLVFFSNPDDGGFRLEHTRPWKALIKVLGHHGEHLLGAARDVVQIVESPHAPRWASGGLRLKDTREWCVFYCEVKNAERANLLGDDAIRR